MLVVMMMMTLTSLNLRLMMKKMRKAVRRMKMMIEMAAIVMLQWPFHHFFASPFLPLPLPLPLRRHPLLMVSDLINCGV